MKNKFGLFIGFLFFVIFGFSQSTNRIYDFFGGKSFNNTTIFYRLVFEINNGKVNGYSFTDERGKNESKSIIEGEFDANTNRISFRETNKLITKSKQFFNEMCFLNGNISLELTNNISTIKGTFVELNAAGKKCTSGKIHIISLDAYQQLKQKIKAEKLFAKTKKETKTKTELKPTFPSFESNKKITIKDDEEISVFWKSDTFKLDIWDDAKEDGDKITITFNDEIIIDKYSLKNKKEQIEIPLKKGKNKLIFTANNTGLIANNTARVDLFDGNIKHQIITQLQLNKSVTVYLIKQ